MPLIRKAASTPPVIQPELAAGKLLAGSAEERWAAARSLAGRPEGVSALAEALKEENDANVREAILTSLARSGGPAGVEAIMPLVRSDDAGRRTSALDALRLMPEALAEHLGVVLTDADTDVRILACDLARQLPGPLATRLLSGVLINEPDVNVCAAAVDVLAEAGDRDALSALAACEARFAASPFLAFAIGVVRQRIDAAPERRG
jgi:HEAT repeat protein